ncbi:unnamed protein product [Ostreobium quekettii]|uniref:Uncharacterized protein n=1 Tax=Ostreobium quekettii TaxID=121088 RepID=A0A8S1JC41_9CHLO|nr:unnamed protein product [Ostreobium quekettii]|eukprot:evm.model.scf_362EXC.6 EVM.evm.TU.scf_362EXC.6   scf_362EXC:44815-45589(+)
MCFNSSEHICAQGDACLVGKRHAPVCFFREELMLIRIWLFQERHSQAEKALKQCSFAPKTGRGPENEDARKKLPVTERLYHAFDDRGAVRAKLRMEQEQSRVKQCTFKPATNTQCVKLDGYTPIQDRVPELQQKKKEKLLMHKLGQAADPNMTFAPALNSKSIQLAQEKGQRGIQDEGPGTRCSDCANGRLK